VVVYSKRKDGQLEEIGRSEVTLNSLNPSWMTKISVQYQFEVLQPLLFQVFDIDPHLHDVSEKMLKLEEQQFLGEATCLLSEVCFFGLWKLLCFSLLCLLLLSNVHLVHTVQHILSVERIIVLNFQHG